MALGGIFLKRKEDVVFEQIWDTVLQVLKNTGYVYGVYDDTFKRHQELFVCEHRYSDKVYGYRYSDKCFIMYLHGTQEELKEDDGYMFEWMGKGDSLYRVIIIEDISGSEDMVLQFVHEYLKLNPDDIFYDELDWYYTKADIDKIIERKFDTMTWCYTNPAEI